MRIDTCNWPGKLKLQLRAIAEHARRSDRNSQGIFDIFFMINCFCMIVLHDRHVSV